MFETARENSGSDVQGMLDRLEQRVTAKKLDQEKTETAIGKVAEAIVKAKSIADGINVDSAEEKDVVALVDITDPRRAWARNGILNGNENKPLRIALQKIVNSTDSADRYARQMWRTEMVSYVAERLLRSAHPDKAAVMERVLAALPQSKEENDPMRALTSAMNLDLALKDRAARTALAEKMKRARRSSDLVDFATAADVKIESVKVLVGGAMMSIPLDLTGQFKIKQMIEDKSRIYALMENGCTGNLVIIDTIPNLESPAPTSIPEDIKYDY